jgi:hypothetical protein
MENKMEGEFFMNDHIELHQGDLIGLNPEIKMFLDNIRAKSKGPERRQFMAHVVSLMGKGGQRRAQGELGWNRNTIRKGMKELKTGITCVDNFSGRGRKPSEEKFPSLLKDIKSIIEPICQTDPTFKSTQLYAPITAKEVHKRLIDFKGYSAEDIPSVITINRKMNQLGYRLKKIVKCKPKKNSGNG